MRVEAERVLIVLLGAIGDVARALPLLARLRAGYPRARIAWALEPAAAPLLEHHPALDDRLVFARAGGVRAFARFLGAVRDFRADLTLDLQRHAKSGCVSFASRAPVRIGFHRRNAKELNWLWNTHTIDPVDPRGWKVEQYLRFADLLELPPAAPTGVALTATEETQIETLLGEHPRPFAAFFLASTWESRLWFAAGYARLAESLAQRGLDAVLVGAADASAIAAETRTLARVPLLDLTARTTLRETYGILARARLAVGPDCGPMHLAAAAGTPVVSLWGATTPARSAPRGSEDLVLVGRVACTPCYRRTCPIGRRCMQAITPERVTAVVDRVLTGRR